MTTATSGPWTVDAAPDGSFSIYAKYSEARAVVIAQRGRWSNNVPASIANAKLIAAAPDLLVALRIILRRLDSAAAEVDCFNVYESRDLARDAIAKAES